MKTKILPVLLFVSLLMLHSCSKIVSEKPAIVQTTTRDIVSDSNTIKLSDAVKIAKGFLQDISHNSSISIRDAVTITKKGVPFLHVINTNNNQGFAILSADSCYTPVLAYNTKGNFSLNAKDLNAGIAVWFNSHSQSIDYIHNNKTDYTDSISIINKSLWRELGYKFNLSSTKAASAVIGSNLNGSRFQTMQLPPPPSTVTLISTTTFSNPPIGPLCGTNWDQLEPYNADCPTTGLLGATAPSGSPYNGHWAAGCGPVAMGQIMYYWKTPNNGRYDWSVMKDLSGQGLHYIPMLLADIGSTGGAIYNFFASGDTFMDDVYAPAVFNSFGYTSASRTTPISAQLTNPINGIAYGSLLVSEIVDYNRPCMITATTGQNNLFLGLLYSPYADFHTWICEGDQQFITDETWQTINYKPANQGPGIANIVTTDIYRFSDYLYMNWGWGLTASADNGFFYNSTVNYTQAYSGLTMSIDPNQNNYLDFQTVVYNIHP